MDLRTLFSLQKPAIVSTTDHQAVTNAKNNVGVYVYLLRCRICLFNVFN